MNALSRLYELAELYDHSTYPLELHNLAADSRVVDQGGFMESKMFRWMVEMSNFSAFS